ncbi:MAG: heme-copper oxidase subunit III [Pirellulaceae bacterium]|nr:heme-copper oxidase subunit III [Pirellulaceae bacterium]
MTANFFNPGVNSDDNRRAQGAWLLLISLGVFFVATIMLYAVYVVLRLTSGTERVAPFYLPLNFIWTTIILIAISICMHLAVEAVRREARTDLLRYLTITLILALAFFGVQSYGMILIVGRFADDASPNRSLYGMTFVLALLHALHVVGGLVAVGVVYLRAWKYKYDHESYFAIRFCALYWHFLDIVWVLMLIAFGIAAALSKTPGGA